MATSNPNPKVDEFINSEGKWHDEFVKLRGILLGFPLTEELKWGVPCYALDGKNVALIHGFKEYCAILFIKGALLKDDRGILVQQTANVQAARQARLTGVQQIAALEDTLKATIAEAIEIERAGLEVELKSEKAYEVAEEFRCKIDENPTLRTAFEALTPGRQRAYLLYFAAPKQARTREARVEKCIPQILSGKGLDD